MKNNITIILTLLSLNLIGQINYDVYRVVAHSNEMYVHSISNTIKVPQEHAIFVPNVFSPNNDGINDYFRVMGKGLDHITIEIYNRWSSPEERQNLIKKYGYSFLGIHIKLL